MNARAEREQEARRLRDSGLLFREIAERMGVAVSTVDAWINDPGGVRLKARKDSYRGECRDCGAQTDGSNGLDGAPERCHPCTAKWRREMTRRWVVDSMREWAEMYGGPPSAADWNPAYCAAYGMQWKVERYNEAARPWPGSSVVISNFGSWNAGMTAAGFSPRRVGHYENRGLEPRDREETIRLYRSGLSCAEVGEALGITTSAVLHRLDTAGEPRRRTGPRRRQVAA